jgi:hypothetical protein
MALGMVLNMTLIEMVFHRVRPLRGRWICHKLKVGRILTVTARSLAMDNSLKEMMQYMRVYFTHIS